MHSRDCGYCQKRIKSDDRSLKRVNDEWASDYLKARRVDPTINSLLHQNCYREMLKKKKDGTLFDCFISNSNQDQMDIDDTDFDNQENNQHDSEHNFDQSYFIDFYTIDDQRCEILTGIKKDQFLELLELIKEVKISTKVSNINALAFYLMRLRTGLSVKKLWALFPIACYRTVLNVINSVRKCLNDKFTALYVGFNSLTRQDVIKFHTNEKARILLGKKFFFSVF